jgi:hypothetical protein
MYFNNLADYYVAIHFVIFVFKIVLNLYGSKHAHNARLIFLAEKYKKISLQVKWWMIYKSNVYILIVSLSGKIQFLKSINGFAFTSRKNNAIFLKIIKIL